MRFRRPHVTPISHSSVIDHLTFWYALRHSAMPTAGRGQAWTGREVGRYFERVTAAGELVDEEPLVLKIFEEGGDESWTVYAPDLRERMRRHECLLVPSKTYSEIYAQATLRTARDCVERVLQNTLFRQNRADLRAIPMSKALQPGADVRPASLS